MVEAKRCHEALIQSKKTLALAESCTGGALCSAFVELPGASAYLLGSVVSYSDSWKTHFLGVDPKILEEKGAVSEETVLQMVEGLFRETGADFALATSGIAGPTGGSKEKPVGTLWVGFATRGGVPGARHFTGPAERGAFRQFAVKEALGVLWSLLT